jgi:hypothetical protein
MQEAGERLSESTGEVMFGFLSGSFVRRDFVAVGR